MEKIHECRKRERLHQLCASNPFSSKTVMVFHRIPWPASELSLSPLATQNLPGCSDSWHKLCGSLYPQMGSLSLLYSVTILDLVCKYNFICVWQDCVKFRTEKLASFQFMSVNLNWMGQTPQVVELEWLKVELTEMQFKDFSFSFEVQRS